MVHRARRSVKIQGTFKHGVARRDRERPGSGFGEKNLGSAELDRQIARRNVIKQNLDPLRIEFVAKHILLGGARDRNRRIDTEVIAAINSRGRDAGVVGLQRYLDIIESRPAGFADGTAQVHGKHQVLTGIFGLRRNGRTMGPED